jgi:hypothetical protein
MNQAPPPELCQAHRFFSEANADAASALVVTAETHRREPSNPRLNTYPLAQVADYSGPAQTLSMALAHLDESVPNGQLLRTSYAYRAAQLALAEYGVWLRAKGYAVWGL